MNDEGYPAFVAWCVTQGIEPMSEDQYTSWSSRRFQRYMREAVETRNSSRVAHPTLF